MKVSISYRAQEMFDKALAYRPISGKGYKVWVDEPTGTLCKVSTLSGSVMGFISVGSNHPWFHREDCPLPGISSYGTISHPAECRELWWFYFSLDGNGKKVVEKAMQKCRILAAQLEIESTELAQQIAQLSLLKSMGSADVVDDKVRRTSEVWGNCNPSPWVTHSTGDPKAWENCTLTEFPVLSDNYKATDKYQHAYKDLMRCIEKEIAKYASDDELEAIIRYMRTN